MGPTFFFAAEGSHQWDSSAVTLPSNAITQLFNYDTSQLVNYDTSQLVNYNTSQLVNYHTTKQCD
jgi:hypothetical protein